MPNSQEKGCGSNKAGILTKKSSKFVDDRPLLLSSKEAAIFLGFSSDSWLRKMRCQGYLSTNGKDIKAPIHVKRGGRIFYRRSDLIDYVAEMPSYRW